MHASNLFYTEPGVRLAERLAESFEPGARVFLCNSGAEANEAAIKLARKRRPRRRDRRARGRLPRPHDGRAVGDAAARQAGAVRAARARASSWCRATTRSALAAAVGERTAAVMLEPIQGEMRRLADLGARCCSPPARPATAPARC